MNNTVYKLLISYLEKQKYYYSLFAVGIVIFLMNNNLGYGLLFLAPFFLTYMTNVGIFISEKSDDFEKFLCSLPITRKEIVTSKYLNLMIVALINIAISGGVGVLINQLELKHFVFNMDYIILFFNAVLLFAAVTFPLFFYMDDIKIFGRLSFFFFIILALGKKIINFIIKILKNYNDLYQIISSIIYSNYLFYIVLAFVLTIFIFSYILSIKLFRKKEL